MDAVFTNAKWLFKLNGSVTVPLEINVGAGYQARQGYPFPQSVLSPNRANSAGQIRRCSIRSATCGWTRSSSSTSRWIAPSSSAASV